MPKKIAKEFVHKKQAENVMISEPQRYGNIWYFNMFEKSPEFNFDHQSDHVQGMLLTEVARQTGIATIHLNGLSINGKLNMGEMHVVFNRYVEFENVVVVRSISNNPCESEVKNPKFWIAVNLIQYGKICASVYFKGLVFNSEDDMNELRNRTVKVNDINKNKYKNFLNEIRK